MFSNKEGLFMNISLLKRLINKPFYFFMAGLIYKILQDRGIIIPPEEWAFYIDSVLYILLALGIIVDTSTPGLGDCGDPNNKIKNEM